MKVLVRADASVEIGMGHRVRCQALMRAFEQLDWQCQYVVDARYKSFADEQDCFIENEKAFWMLAEQVDLVILDHYGYQAEDINALYQHQNNLLVLDDMNDRGPFSTRWLLNPLYEQYSSSVEFPLLGGQYALLRPEFIPATYANTERNKLLITLGGTDPLSLTLPILEALLTASFPPSSIQVMVGKNATNAENVRALCEQHQIALEQGVSDVTPLMASAKMAISAAGGTLFELACLGVPTLFAQVADNQTRSLEQHVPLNWCRSVSFYDVPPEDREERVRLLIGLLEQKWSKHEWQDQARKTAQGLVDGQGANRVASTIHSYMTSSTTR